MNYPHAKTQAKAYALIAEHGPERVRWRLDDPYRGAPWQTFEKRAPTWDSVYEYEVELVPATGSIHVDGLPLPETEAPEEGTKYYIASPGFVEWYEWDNWTDKKSRRKLLERGLVYLNKDDAITVAKAMRVKTEVR